MSGKPGVVEVAESKWELWKQSATIVLKVISKNPSLFVIAMGIPTALTGWGFLASLLTTPVEWLIWALVATALVSVAALPLLLLRSTLRSWQREAEQQNTTLARYDLFLDKIAEAAGIRFNEEEGHWQANGQAGDLDLVKAVFLGTYSPAERQLTPQERREVEIARGYNRALHGRKSTYADSVGYSTERCRQLVNKWKGRGLL